jgi:hypothetical protein
MTETNRRRLDAERRTAATAEQISRQRRGAALLGEMLARGAAEGLPAIAWTIGSADAALAGRCEARQMDQRRQDFNAWRLRSARGRARAQTPSASTPTTAARSG